MKKRRIQSKYTKRLAVAKRSTKSKRIAKRSADKRKPVKRTKLSKGTGPPPRGLKRGISAMAKALKRSKTAAKKRKPVKRGGGFKTHAMRVTTSSKKHKWRTDPRLIALIEKFAKGKIGLDPCASKDPKYHFAKVNYTLHNGKDGLKEPWTGFGVTYANPEYARSKLSKFIMKGVDEFVNYTWLTPPDDRFEAVALKCRKKDHLFLLVPARPDTRWFHNVLLKYSTAMCFWRSRLKFSGKDPAPFPSLIVYFGHKPKRFRKLFSKYGWVPATGGVS